MDSNCCRVRLLITLAMTPRKWHTNIPNYARVRYRDLYPPELTSFTTVPTQGKLEYDVTLSPGAEVERVRFKFDAQEPIGISARGDLVLGNVSRVLQYRPVAYQQIGGEKRYIPARYRVEKSGRSYLPLATTITSVPSSSTP